MGAEDLIHHILTSEAISEVIQNDFNLKTMTTLPKHVILIDNKEDRNEIIGLYRIKNPFKLMNISPHTKVREIGSVASGQAISKAVRSALKTTPNFAKDNQVRHKKELNVSSYSAKETSKQEEKYLLTDSV